MNSKNGSHPPGDERIALVIENLSRAFRRIAQHETDPAAFGYARAHCADALEVLDLILGI